MFRISEGQEVRVIVHLWENKTEEYNGKVLEQINPYKFVVQIKPDGTQSVFMYNPLGDNYFSFYSGMYWTIGSLWPDQVEDC